MSLAQEFDASEAFRLLAQQERESREYRIGNAIRQGNDEYAHRNGNGATGVMGVQERQHVAAVLYDAFYSFAEDPTDTQFLEQFCWTVFGCSSREVLAAWDKELG